ncbi:DMT family transporter [Sediminibacterium goheungense]|uniref:EamA domain-containing membrane protein RarD n=1 Tax=Sediminibacterium goheungense TaxID=1086393 RepID=A0A4R6IZ16_9BACT|nr:DMT family transporter [Sediminibacterium goheungense]TDO28109.1 EamA domain-containing membrane protein RarD [Sediminibacterium goheungense]
MHPAKKDYYTGIALAVLATIIWSGNFVISRAVNQQIPPVSLAFYRWALATVLIAPLAYKKFTEQKQIVFQNWKYLFWVSLSGITLFNTFVYVAGHYTSAINMALIGTTSSPIFATVMAIIFLKERLNIFRITGILICIAGIILLLSQGSWEKLASFTFSTGDLWILAGALAFAVYNILVRKKPAGITPVNFLFVIFFFGTLLLLPAYIIERNLTPAVQWNGSIIGSVVYLGLGTSVISFLCWNAALQKLGTGTTVLFGNLIPIFSTLEAVWLLGEKITDIHIISGLLVIGGLILANTMQRKKTNA